MSQALWKIEPKKLCDLTPEETEAILFVAYKPDDGTYYLDKKLLKGLKPFLNSDSYLTLKEELKANIDFNFIIG